MSSGFRLDTDAWLKDYDEAKTALQEVVQVIQDRNLNHPDGGPEASRQTATARRKLGSLGTEAERLLTWLDSAEAKTLSEQEKYRRRDLVYALKTRREQMLQSLKRTQHHQGRESLLQGAGAKQEKPRETEATAPLDNRGLLQLQNQVMQQQDQELENMEKTIISTKHIALAVGEEVDLHTRLLEEVDDEAGATYTKLRAAHKRLRHVLKHSSNWKLGLFVFILIITLVVVSIIGFKLARFFV